MNEQRDAVSMHASKDTILCSFPLAAFKMLTQTHFESHMLKTSDLQNG